MSGADLVCDPRYHHQHEKPRVLPDGATVTKLARRWLPEMGNEVAVPQREKYGDIYCVISKKDGTITYMCVICLKHIKEAYVGLAMPFSNMMKHIRSQHPEQLTILDQADTQKPQTAAPLAAFLRPRR